MIYHPEALPQGWERASFKDLFRRIERRCTIEDAQFYDCVGARWYGGGAFIRERLSGVEITRKQQWIVHSGDLVYNKLFAWKGAFAIADESADRCIVSDKFPTYEINLGLVDPGFLRYYLMTPALASQSASLSKGAAAISKLTLNPPQFWNLTMPLPPLDEQRVLVQRINETAARIDHMIDLRSGAVRNAQSIFGSYLDRVMNRLSELHPMQSLLDVADSTRGISYGVVQTGLPYEDGVPTLRAGNLQRFRVILDDVKRIDPMVADAYHRTSLYGGEVLLKIRGGFGEVAVCPDVLAGGNVSREIAVIPFTDEILSRYGMYALSAPSNQKIMASNLRGTSYVGINLRDVRNVSIPVPPVSTQGVIVTRLDELLTMVDSLIAAQEASHRGLRMLLPSILDKTFKGQL
jgi:type I restriction enzyme S subunit